MAVYHLNDLYNVISTSTALLGLFNMKDDDGSELAPE